MSISMGGDEDMTDYSSFKYQQVRGRLVIDQPANTQGNSPRAVGITQVEPLRSVGGLEQNEVAELVYLEVFANMEFESESADQNVGQNTEHRGSVGINLPSNDAAFVNDGDIVDGKFGQNTDGLDTNTGNTRVQAVTRSEDRILQMYKHHTGPAFDTGSGPGGGHSSDHFHATKNYREMTGRGPVIDASDDITLAQAVISGDILLEHRGVLTAHMVWDVAETSDAGRRFSVPS